jgi:hypothetical protein
VALVTASAVFGLASPASANLVGPGAITCTSVTFSYTLFPAGSNTIANQVILIDGVLVFQHAFQFSGAGGGDTVPIPVKTNNETIKVLVMWSNTVHGQGSGSFSAVVKHCINTP